ncbi:hypothetical protein OROHE_006681 [Orobanche hederae]
MNMLSATMTSMKSLSRIESQSVSTISSELAEESDMKDLVELVGIDKPSKWVVVATIDRLQSRFGWYYNSCQKCLRKAEEIGGSIRCRKCKNTNIIPRFKVGVIAMDNTSSVSLILFDQHVNQLLGHNAKDLKEKVEQQGGSDFTFPDELNDLKGTTCLFKFEVSDYNIQSKYHHYTVSKLGKDKDEIESFLARKKSIVVRGAVYDGCGDSHATCPLANIVNESSSSISDNVADTTLTGSYMKRRRLFSDEDLVVNTDADWESQHSTKVKDPAGVMKDATMLEDIYMLSATMTPMKSLSRIESQSVSTILSELAEESDMKDLIELVGIDKPSKWVVVATIDRLQSRFGWYYNSCQKCLRKAEEIGGSIRCRKWFKVGVIAMDNTSSVSLILFDQHVNQLLGHTAKDLKEKVEQQGGSDFTFPDELNDLKGTTCLFKFEVSNYNIQSKYHHYTVSKLSKDKDEIESFLARKKSIVVRGAVYDGCGDSHATCPLANIVNESSSSISDNVADTTPTDSYIKRRRLFSDEDLVVNTDADWESQHSTNVKDPAGVMKDATMLEDI